MIRLDFFEPHEFTRDGTDWFDRMDPRLLVRLDIFRFRWGKPIEISPHPAALGRHAGQAMSDHNVDMHGAVRAADIMPEGMDDADQVKHAIELAKEIGFTAIGFYPDWNPQPGLHLGVRDSRAPGAPALWGGIRPDPNGPQHYVTLDAAIARA